MNNNVISYVPRQPDWDQYLPGISIDCVIFGYRDQTLKILILEYKKTDLHALPGGFIGKTENLDDAAVRVLHERTGLSDIYLNQFQTFGSLRRYDRKPIQTILEKNNMAVEENSFLLSRFVSVCYYALIDTGKAEPVADYLSDSCRWVNVEELPELIQDHREMVDTALKHLQQNIDNQAVGLNLLEDLFTMQELQKLYETILGKELNRTGFHRKMMLSKRLERVGKKITGKAHRSPYLYRFKKS
jgi:8-oxo-dGTP diphosphatase